MLTDTHCHLDFQIFDQDRHQILERAAQHKVTRIINPGTNIETSKAALQMANQFTSVSAAVGIHPNEDFDLDKSTMQQLRILSSHPNVVAIGEIGLDYLPESPPKPIQVKAFENQIDIAIRNQLPIVFHMRESNEDTLNILEDNIDKIIGGASHYFQGSLKDAERLIGMGLYVSFAKPLLRDQSLQLIAKKIPIDNIVLETDSYPQYFKKKRERWTEPKDILFVAEKLSFIKDISIEEVIDQTTKNALELFKLSR